MTSMRLRVYSHADIRSHEHEALRVCASEQHGNYAKSEKYRELAAAVDAAVVSFSRHDCI